MEEELKMWEENEMRNKHDKDQPIFLIVRYIR